MSPTRNSSKKRKSLSLDQLDQVVGGNATAPAAQDQAKQQAADVMAQVQIEAASAKASAATVPEAGGFKASAPELPGAAAKLAVIDSMTHDIAAAIGNYGPEKNSPEGYLRGLIEGSQAKIAQTLGCSDQAANCVAYAVAYKAVFEDGATGKLPDNSAYMMKQIFSGNGFGQMTAELGAAIKGAVIQASLSGDVGGSLSHLADDLGHQMSQAVGWNRGSFDLAVRTVLDQGAKLAAGVPGSALASAALDEVSGGGSARLVNCMFTTIQAGLIAKEVGATDVLRLVNDIRHTAAEVLRAPPQGGNAAITATIAMLSEVAEKCQSWMYRKVAADDPYMQIDRDMRPQLLNVVFSDYAKCAAAAGASAATLEIARNLVADVVKGSSPGDTNLQRACGAAVAELGQLAKAGSGNALAALSELVAIGGPGAVSALENLARSNADAFAAFEVLARRGSASALDTLQNFARSGTAGAMDSLESLVRDRVDGASACCFLTESGFPKGRVSDSRFMLGRKASMDDKPLFGRSSGTGAGAR